jgi:hypothetical protein
MKVRARIARLLKLKTGWLKEIKERELKDN